MPGWQLGHQGAPIQFLQNPELLTVASVTQPLQGSPATFCEMRMELTASSLSA